MLAVAAGVVGHWIGGLEGMKLYVLQEWVALALYPVVGSKASADELSD